MSVRKHEEDYWHIKKFGFRPMFLLIYIVLTTISILWVMFNLDQDKSVLAIPMIILTLGCGYGWITCWDKIFN